MAGIYIHIPFCRTACNYCDFHFSTSLTNKTELVECLVRELELRKDYLNGETIETVYFGGGTPSLLSKSELNDIFNQLYKLFTIHDKPEITLEANPDDLTAGKIAEIQSSPVNRLSIGIQSFFDKDLQWMNRLHTSGQAVNSVKQAQDAGLTNLSVDLIYGLPNSTNEEWSENLAKAFALHVPHISSYCLTVEEKTKLAHLIQLGKVAPADEEKTTHQFNMLVEQMKKNDFVHYEISNFCKPGHFARHNSNYWKGIKYLGIGPSAHSFNGTSRQWNKASNSGYISAVKKDIIAAEKEILTPNQRFNEYIMTSLRTMWGCDLDKVNKDFGAEYNEAIVASSLIFIEQGLMERSNNFLLLAPKGKFIADKIIAELFKI